jgi:hypothetical protein
MKSHTVVGTPVHHQLTARAAAAKRELSGNDRDQDANKIDPRGAAGIGDGSEYTIPQPEFSRAQLERGSK